MQKQVYMIRPIYVAATPDKNGLIQDLYWLLPQKGEGGLHPDVSVGIAKRKGLGVESQL